MKKKTIGIIIWILFVIVGFFGMMFASSKTLSWIIWGAAFALGGIIYSVLKKKDDDKKE